MRADHVAIIGGGIIGCAAAAFLTEAGANVEVYEREEVGAAASGRNAACSTTRSSTSASPS